MRVLVIGGAGYIGSHVARELLDGGHRVRVYDNLSSGRKSNIYPEAEFVQGDILDGAALLKALEGQDAVIHLAAFKAAGESMEKPEKYSVNNICGALSLLNAMCQAGVKRIVFSSSAAVYGEPEYLPIDEKHPTKPENYYGFTKLEIERFLEWYDKLKGIRYAALRYFNAAGYNPEGRMTGLERNPANLLPVIMEVAMGWREKLNVFGMDYPTRDGTCVRDYVHVSDLAEAHLKALSRLEKTDRSLTVNLGSGEGITVLEMLAAARKITGKPIHAEMSGRRAGDPVSLTASSALAEELLGWKATRSSVESLVQTSWEAYRVNAAKPE